MTPRAVRGASLPLVLILLAISMAGALSLVREVTGASLVAGNLAFRQAALSAADAGSEAAVRWLQAQLGNGDLHSDQPAAGYYASAPAPLRITGPHNATTIGIDWDNDHCGGQVAAQCLPAAPPLPVTPEGNQVRFVVHRLCSQAGSAQAAGNRCLTTGTDTNSSKRGGLSYADAMRFAPEERVYYRITSYVRGPRHTRVFVQTLVYFQ